MRSLASRWTPGSLVQVFSKNEPRPSGSAYLASTYPGRDEKKRGLGNTVWQTGCLNALDFARGSSAFRQPVCQTVFPNPLFFSSHPGNLLARCAEPEGRDLYLDIHFDRRTAHQVHRDASDRMPMDWVQSCVVNIEVQTKTFQREAHVSTI